VLRTKSPGENSKGGEGKSGRGFKKEKRVVCGYPQKNTPSEEVLRGAIPNDKEAAGGCPQKKVRQEEGYVAVFQVNNAASRSLGRESREKERREK